MLNPARPAAVGSRHYTQQAVGEAVLGALAPLVPHFAWSGSQISFPALKAGGFDRRPARRAGRNDMPYFAITDLLGGGGCATSRGDGMSAIDTHGGNCELLSAEVMERAAPIRVLRTELVPDSGGRGRFRGGLAIRRDYELLCDGVNVNAYVQQVEERTRPRGGDGGEPGGLARVALNPGTDAETTLPSKAMGLRLDAGTVIRLQSSGGGGLGDPAERSPERARRDRELGYTTR